MNKVYIETYGCQMNVADTEVVFSILGKAGYVRTEQIAEADVIMANTCSIRDNAEQRILGRIEQFNIYRKARPGVVTGILGCMAERLKEELLKLISPSAPSFRVLRDVQFLKVLAPDDAVAPSERHADVADCAECSGRSERLFVEIA